MYICVYIYTYIRTNIYTPIYIDIHIYTWQVSALQKKGDAAEQTAAFPPPPNPDVAPTSPTRKPSLGGGVSHHVVG